MQTDTSVPNFPKNELKNDFFYQSCLKHLSTSPQFVLQIGAFDGVTYDELFPILSTTEKWQALLIEPTHSAFNALIENYKNRSNFIFENCAITEREEIRQMWSIPYELKNNPNLPAWAVGCSTLLHNSNSLFGKHCTKEEHEALKKHTVIDFVQCYHLNTILTKHNIEKIDIVHIDAEGYDWKILKQLNLEKFKPKIIHFEFFNLNEDDFGEAKFYLDIYGYDLYSFENNITATNLKMQFIQKPVPFMQRLKYLLFSTNPVTAARTIKFLN